jgi:hypothetical protein
MTSLDPDLEKTLTLSTLKTSPLSLEMDILPRILEFEKEQAKENRWEKALTPILIFSSAVPVFLAWYFRREIKSLFGSLDVPAISIRLGTLVSEIALPKIDLAGIANTFANSPLVILSLITITAVLWAFSINEAQKALK